MIWLQQYDWSKRPDISPAEHDTLKCKTEPWAIATPWADEHPRWSFAGFGIEGDHFGTGIAYVYVVVPYWALTLTGGCVAVYAARRTRTASAGERHVCPKCGYDLRATPERCPECGAAPPHNPAMERTVPAV